MNFCSMTLLSLEEDNVYLFPLLQTILIHINAHHAVRFDQSEDGAGFAWQWAGNVARRSTLQCDSDIVFAADLRGDVCLQCCLDGFCEAVYGFHALTAQATNHRPCKKIENHQRRNRITRQA